MGTGRAVDRRGDQADQALADEQRTALLAVYQSYVLD